MTQVETKKETVKSAPTKVKKDLKYLRDRDREMVRGIFRFFEVPGGTMQFSFRKYKDDPIENFTLVDGEVYTIPRGVAHHLSNNCWYPNYEYRTNEGFHHVAMVTRKKRRCSFEPLEFMDVEDLSELQPSNIEIVTPIK